MAFLIISPSFPRSFFIFSEEETGVQPCELSRLHGDREGAPSFTPAVRLPRLPPSPSCSSVPFVRTLFCQAESQASYPTCGKKENTLWLTQQRRDGGPRSTGSRLGAREWELDRSCLPGNKGSPGRPRRSPPPGPRGLMSFPPAGRLPQRRVGP